MLARKREESAKTEGLVFSPFGETSITNSAGEGTDRAAEETHIPEW